MKVYSILEETARRYPSNPALVDELGTITFRELLLQVKEARKAMSRYPISRGMGIGLRCHNSRFFVISLLALSSCEAVVMPIGAHINASELSTLFNEIPLHGIFTEEKLTLHDSQYLAAGRVQIGNGSFVFYKSRTDHPDFAPHVKGAAFVRPTSGTTGRSKGVILSHRSIFERIDAAQAAFKLTADDKVLWVLPMAYHFIVSILLYLRSGSCMVVCKDNLAETILDAAERHSPTLLYASPTHFALLADDRSSRTLSSLRLAICTSGGASPSLVRRFEERFSLPLRQVYGIIELGLPVGNLRAEPASKSSVGYPLPHYEAAILDDAGEPKPFGEVGELALRGPGMFDAYLSPPVWREEILKNGWFLTGDLAHFDDTGAIRVVGRKKSLIITAGNKVFPEEVENVLNEYPAVFTCRVYGKKHALIGEVVSADIVLRKDAKIREEEIRLFCHERLSAFKTPQEVQFVNAIALTGTGKIIRSQ